MNWILMKWNVIKTIFYSDNGGVFYLFWSNSTIEFSNNFNMNEAKSNKLYQLLLENGGVLFLEEKSNSKIN